MMAEDWEIRDAHTPLQVHMIAGCFAGLIEHISMLPLDNVKVQYISTRHISKSCPIPMYDKLSEHSSIRISVILRNHGIRSYFNGAKAVMAGCMPAHALYFSSYEYLKIALDVDDEQHHPIQFAIIGALSTFSHDFIMTPFDVVKQRQQLLEMPFRRTLKKILKYEGVKALYRSFPVTYLMTAPFQAIFFAANETFKLLIATKQNHNFGTHFASAALAGAVAVTTVNPLDVIKTKLQTQNWYLNNSKTKYFNVFDTIKTIRAEEGIRGFYKGLLPRMCMQTLSGATAWASYEYLKKFLLDNHY